MKAILLPLTTVFFPDNAFGIEPRHYGYREIVALLREYKSCPEAIQFIADMLE